MQKVCIVTVYNSINSGSYWQAFVLGETLKSIGYDVSFLKRKGNFGSSNTFRAFLIRMIKRLIKKGFYAAIRETKRYISFLRYWKMFDLKKDKNYSDIYCFVLGSDTIWNISSKYFKNNRHKYWGGEFKQNYIITYAASVGDTNKDVIYQYKELFQYVNVLRSISVRDAYTQEVIMGMTNKRIDIVCDPTLLWNKENYRQYIGNQPTYKYIFLYLFKPLSDEQFDELRRFANINNLKIVNGVYDNKRADVIIENEPYNFIRHMYYADYVVTDTFHGTVFSTNFEKRFVVVNRNKNKIYDFLSRFSLLDRLTSGSVGLISILNNEVQYEKTMNILKIERAKSNSFLINALNEIQG